MNIDAYAGHSATMPASRPGQANGRATPFSLDLGGTEPASDEIKDALTALRAEARKTPRERCRDQVMREWHITQDQIDKLPPKEAQALEDRINAEVARRMQTAEPNAAGDPAATTGADQFGGEAQTHPSGDVSTAAALSLRIVPGRTDANGLNFQRTGSA